MRLNFTAVVSDLFRDMQQKTLKSLSDQLREMNWLEREWPLCSLMFRGSFETRALSFCCQSSGTWFSKSCLRDLDETMKFHTHTPPNSLHARMRSRRAGNNEQMCFCQIVTQKWFAICCRTQKCAIDGVTYLSSACGHSALMKPNLMLRFFLIRCTVDLQK